MLDRYNRKIHYLRISVTDRCNLRCSYCMTGEDVKFLPKEDLLSFEEIRDVVKVAVSLGIDKIRLTGGEPLVRHDVVKLVELINKSSDVKDISLTTNGILLEKYAKSLANAGLQRVNISLDTVSPHKFCNVTRGGNIEKVFAGIEAAKIAGLHPVKINCVIENDKDIEEAKMVKEFCEQKGLYPQFIKRMNLKEGKFSVVENGSGGHCERCNRLRLTCDGKLKPCLFSDVEFDIKKYGILKAFELAVDAKPEKGTKNQINMFNNIGG